jgi:dolichyl-phosphate beta-glucosyltransferase
MKDSLSVVVPAFNEEPRLPGTLKELSTYLNANFREYEIIVVDDGSSDGTASIVKGLGRELPNISLLSYPLNAGKGYATRKGVLSSSKDLVLTCDADMSTPIREYEKLVPFVRDHFDIAIGSRGLEDSEIVVRQPWYRELMGKTFNVFVRTLVFEGIRDTQCGFKLFRGDVARRLFKDSIINGFAFDVEILFLARRSGYKIKEVPIQWLNSPNSKVRIMSDPFKMFLELFRIKANRLFGRYDKSY